MDIRAMATRPTGMDGLVEDTTSQISETTMIGKTITAPDITIRSAATAALAMRVALAVGTALVAGMEEASVVAASAAAMAAAEATAVVAGIARQIAVQLGRRNHA